MRHVLGIIGVLAASVLLAVSAAINWRFGYQLGKTEFDGFIYGAASAAADCLKALVPFFFFAAVRNRMWSQAAAAAAVGLVVTAYSLTSALGHAALNRQDTTGQRAIDAQHYKDLRADLKRAQEQLSWVPKHRPAQAVQSDIDNLKNQRAWEGTKGCTDVNGKRDRDFCQQFHALNAEHASAQQTAAQEKRIAEIQEKLGSTSAGTVMAEADPQAVVLARLTGLDVDKVQMGLTIFVAILLEIGSAFGMYIAFSQWRLYDRSAPEAPAMLVLSAPAARTASSMSSPVPRSRLWANDNKSAVPRLSAPEGDVQRFYNEMIVPCDGVNTTSSALYSEYVDWCRNQQKEPLSHMAFSRDLSEHGVQKKQIGGKPRYIGIALKPKIENADDHKGSAANPQAARSA